MTRLDIQAVQLQGLVIHHIPVMQEWSWPFPGAGVGAEGDAKFEASRQGAQVCFENFWGLAFGGFITKEELLYMLS